MKKYLMLAVAYLLMGLYASAVIAQTKKMNTKEIYLQEGASGEPSTSSNKFVELSPPK